MAMNVKTTCAMLLVQMVYAAVNILYKVASSRGMSLPVIVVYRGLFSAGIMIPLAIFMERKNRPKITIKVLVQAFFCGLFGGSLSQNLSLESLKLTSATFATAMMNLLPGMAFFLAVLFSLEVLRWGTKAGKAKVLGTLVGIGGAMLLTFYKGSKIQGLETHIHFAQNKPSAAPEPHSQVLGLVLAVSSCLANAIWLILQAKLSQSYQGHFSSTALMSLMSSIQAAGYALWRERDPSQWRFGWDIRLLTVSFAGIVGTALNITVITWCMSIRGPLFVSIFNPLMLLIVALAGSLVLDEKLHTGSLLGGGLIVGGLYMVLWGKYKEQTEQPQKSQNLELSNILVSSPETIRSLGLSTGDIDTVVGGSPSRTLRRANSI